MEIGRYLVEAHLREGRGVADLARSLTSSVKGMRRRKAT